MSAFDPKRTLHFGLLSRSGAPLIHEGQRFWAAHVTGLQSVKLETAVFDQLLDWSVEVTTTANTFPKPGLDGPATSTRSARRRDHVR